MSIEELDRRDASTINTRRVVNRATNVLFKGHLNGVVVEHTVVPDNPWGEIWWYFTGATEFFTVPDGVTELLISGMGGINSTGGLQDPFGSFLVEVEPGEVLEIIVGGEGDGDGGGFPDGGAPDFYAAGGSGSSTVEGTGRTLFVAPGHGGLAFGSDAGGGGFSWTAYGYDAPDFAFADPLAEAMVPYFVGDLYDGFGWSYVDANTPGGAGGPFRSNGGDGAAKQSAFVGDPEQSGGGGGGGGWASGAGGTTQTRHYVRDDDGSSGPSRNVAIGGSAGSPYAHGFWDQDFIGFPITPPPEDPDEYLASQPYIYFRWQIPD